MVGFRAQILDILIVDIFGRVFGLFTWGALPRTY